MRPTVKVAAAITGLLIIGTALGTLGVQAEGPTPRDPSKSSYMSVNEGS